VYLLPANTASDAAAMKAVAMVFKQTPRHSRAHSRVS
jgi:hypothetical protein